MSARADLVIAGGGPAGAALAIELAGAGRKIVLVERETGPHDKVCGEFLSGEALGALARLGLDVAALGAVPIGEVRLVCGASRVARRLPFAAASLSRRVLDEALIERARAAGAEIRRGVAVRALDRTGDGWRAGLGDGSEIFSREAALATGKHDLRGWTRPEGRQNDLIGFKRHLRLRPEATAGIAGAVEIALFPGGYAGLEPIEEGRANLCLVVGRETYARLGRDWRALLDWIGEAAPAFAARLEGAEELDPRPLAIARIPYGLALTQGEGAWRLGDQAAVIPSLAGEGVSLALGSARRAAAALLKGEAAAPFQRRFATDAGRPVAIATLVSRLIVRRPAQRALFGAARAAPWLIAALGRATRLRGA